LRIRRSCRQADELQPKLSIEQSAQFAIDVKGDFTFESVPSATEEGAKAGGEAKTSQDENEKQKAEARPFVLKDIQLEVPRGQ